jgi:hypothetical protein
MFCAALAVCLGQTAALEAEAPDPVLQSVFPPGVGAGSTVTATIEGSKLEGLRALRSTAPGFVAKKIAGNRFEVSVAQPPRLESTICGRKPITV